ncbi:MAG: hypothetical protein HYX92_01380 [Chloroflexi bacterium]|nr:hypothetical protein [Chloroflexota bacterium]
MVEELLNPIGEVTTPEIKLAKRPTDLSGKVMGILDNKMGESTAVLERLAKRLSERYDLAGQVAVTRVGHSPAEAAEELSRACDFVVAGFGCSGVWTIWCVQTAVELEKRGIPTVMACTQGLDAMCQAEARCMGLASLPLPSVPVPEDAKFEGELLEKAADSLTEDVIFALTQPVGVVAQEFGGRDLVGAAEKGVTRPRNYFTLETVKAASMAEAAGLFYERGWTDGLPILPPTEEAVQGMLAYCDRGRDEVIASLPPRVGQATVEKIAVNAVMAGCLPEYLPVIITAIQAVAEPQFNLSALQATTNPVAPITIVNGPLTKELVINSGFNVFGQGWRANATIGRAIRLILMNIGGGLPGTTDKSLQGLPGKYTFCIAENEEESPWEPLHVERGFPRDVSTVTVAGVQAHHNFIVHDRTAESVLAFSASAMTTLGANSMYHGGGWPILALNPQAAAILFRAGYSKQDVKSHLSEHATVALTQFPASARGHLDQKQIRAGKSGESIVHATGPAEHIIVIVTGAAGAHSQYLATFGDFVQPVTKAIARKDGKPVLSIGDLRK